MSHGGLRKGAGRKSKMDQMNYWGWMQDLMVAYLNEPYEQVVIETPLKAYVRSSGILISLRNVQLVFGKQAYDHFHRWFNVKEEGSPETGNSIVAVTTDMVVRTEIYNWLLETGADALIQDSMFMAFEESKASGKLDEMLAQFKKQKRK